MEASFKAVIVLKAEKPKSIDTTIVLNAFSCVKVKMCVRFQIFFRFFIVTVITDLP